MFAKLHIRNWRQFESVDIDFHPRLTILTGANGTGKTTLLHLLNRHWGWNLNFVSGPSPQGNGISKYWAGFWNAENAERPWWPHVGNDWVKIGHITHMNLGSSALFVPKVADEKFEILAAPKFIVHGVYVPSHRPP